MKSTDHVRLVYGMRIVECIFEILLFLGVETGTKRRQVRIIYCVQLCLVQTSYDDCQTTMKKFNPGFKFRLIGCRVQEFGANAIVEKGNKMS